MSKFKIGDRVVFVDAEVAGMGYPDYGQKGTVESLDYDEVKVNFDDSTQNCGTIFSRRFILEELYNSPLYKLMKE